MNLLPDALTIIKQNPAVFKDSLSSLILNLLVWNFPKIISMFILNVVGDLATKSWWFRLDRKIYSNTNLVSICFRVGKAVLPGIQSNFECKFLRMQQKITGLKINAVHFIYVRFFIGLIYEKIPRLLFELLLLSSLISRALRTLVGVPYHCQIL